MLVWTLSIGFRHEGYSLKGLYKSRDEVIAAADKSYEESQPYPDDQHIRCWDLDTNKVIESGFRGGSFDREVSYDYNEDDSTCYIIQKKITVTPHHYGDWEWEVYDPEEDDYKRV